MSAPTLTIVVPAYNESQRIGASLVAMVAWARSFPEPVEILVVDDGSLDDTARIARKALSGWPASRVLVNRRNRGKGYSVRRGVLAARGGVVLASDADLSTPIEEAPRLLERLRAMGRGLVIGSRAVPGSKVEVYQNVIRMSMGKVFNRIVRALTGLPFRDTQCGFKMMTRQDVAPILSRARIDGFSYDVELLYVAMRRGLPIEEIGVIWRNAPGSKVGILSDPLRMLRDVRRIRRWHRMGLYDPGAPELMPAETDEGA